MNIKLLTIKYDNKEKKCSKDFFDEVSKDLLICIEENDYLNIIATNIDTNNFASDKCAFFGFKICYLLGDRPPVMRDGQLYAREFTTNGVKLHKIEEDINFDKEYFEKAIKVNNEREINSNLEIFINSFEISFNIVIRDKNKFYEKIKKHVNEGISSCFFISPKNTKMFEGMKVVPLNN